MNYTTFTPPKHLNELVQCFWALESNPYEVTPKEYFLMADGFTEIIFQYNGGFAGYSKQSARIRIQHSDHNKFVVDNELGFFGVRLYPHAVRQLLRMPASEVVNHVFDFSSHFKQEGRDLTDKIFNCKNTQERIAHVSDFLVKVIDNRKVDPINHFVSQIIASEGQVNISHLKQQSGLSVKQFERRFKAITGFPPKYFARVARFQGAKKNYCSNRIKTLTDLAYTCNYYDQSHFIKEFKEFSGVQPFRYFKFINDGPPESTANRYITSTKVHNVQNGYLPCGWFV